MRAPWCAGMTERHQRAVWHSDVGKRMFQYKTVKINRFYPLMGRMFSADATATDVRKQRTGEFAVRVRRPPAGLWYAVVRRDMLILWHLSSRLTLAFASSSRTRGRSRAASGRADIHADSERRAAGENGPDPSAAGSSQGGSSRDLRDVSGDRCGRTARRPRRGCQPGRARPVRSYWPVTVHAVAVVDTSIIAAFRLYDPADLPDTMLVTAVTLGELSYGPHATDDPAKRAGRVAVLQHAEATFDPLP
jgi:hypothetical protein